MVSKLYQLATQFDLFTICRDPSTMKRIICVKYYIQKSINSVVNFSVAKAEMKMKKQGITVGPIVDDMEVSPVH